MADPIAYFLSTELEITLQEKREIELEKILYREKWSELDLLKVGDAIINLKLTHITKSENYEFIIHLENDSNEFASFKLGEFVELYYNSYPIVDYYNSIKEDRGAM
jgi:hypothetical protein